MTTRKKKPFWTKLLSALLIACMLVGTVGTSSLAAAGDPGDVTEADAVSSDSSNGDEETTPAADTTNTDVTPSDKADPSASKTNLPEGAGDNALLNANGTQTGTSGEGTGGAASGTTGTSDTGQGQKDSAAPGNGGMDEVDPEEEKEEVTPTYATVEEFLAAVAAVGEVDTPEDLLAAIDNCLSIYNKLSPEDKAAQAEAYEYIVGYREEVAAGNPDEGIEELALTTGHSFQVKVAKVYLGQSGNQETKYINVTCTYGSGHSSGNCQTYLKQFYPTNFGWSDGSEWIGYRKDQYGTWSKNSSYNGRFYNWKNDTIMLTCTSGGDRAWDTIYLVYSDPEPDYYAKVVYNSNAGNDVVSGMPSEYKYIGKEEKPSYTLSTDTPTREKYEFKGWATSSTSKNAVSSITLKTSNTSPGTINSVYAIWEPVTQDNGNGISVTKSRVSINGDASKTTADPGDEIKWKITVTNNSNVTKIITLEEQLIGASLKESSFELAAGTSKTVTATYTVKAADKGKTLYNTVKASTGKTGEDKEASDSGTPIAASYKVQWFDNNGSPIKTEETRNGTGRVSVNEEDKSVKGYIFLEKDDRNVLTDDLKADGSTVLKLYFTEQKEEPELVITKRVDRTSIKKGEELTYTIKVENTGKGDATNVVVTDKLPDELTYVSKSTQGSNGIMVNEATAQGNKITWNLGTIKAGDTVEFTFKAKTDKTGRINNVAIVECDENVTDQSDPTPTAIYDFAVTKKNDGFVSEKGSGKATVHYTVTVTNNGEIDLYGLNIKDVLTPEIKIDNESVDATQAEMTLKNVVVSGADGTFFGNTLSVTDKTTTTWNGVIARGNVFGRGEENKVTLEYDIEITNKTTKSIYVNLNNTATCGTWTSTLSRMRSSANDGYVEESADSSASTGTSGAGGTIDPAVEKVTITVKFVDEETGGTVKIETREVEKGEDKTYDVSDLIIVPDGYDEIAKTEGEVTGKADADKTITVTVRKNPKIEITKTADKDKAKPGDEITYTITVKNVGKGAAKGVTVTDVLDSNLKFKNWKLNTEAENGTEPVNDIYNIGDMAAGATEKLYITATVNDITVTKDMKIVNIATADYTNKPKDPGTLESKKEIAVVEENQYIVKLEYVDDSNPANVLQEEIIATLKDGESYAISEDKVLEELSVNGNHYIKDGKPSGSLTGKIDGKDIVITIPYTLDNIGTNPSDPTDTNHSDGIPDKYQAVVTFAAVNGTVTGAGDDGTYKFVVTFVDANGDPALPEDAEELSLTDAQIPETMANAGYSNGVWDVEPNGAVITGDTTFTIRYSATTPTTPTTPPGGGGGNNDDDDDDDDDPTPTPSTPQTPGPTPIIPGPVPTVGPTTTVVPNVTPVAATPVAPTPTAALVSPTPEAVELADEAVPLAAEEEKEQPEPVAVDEEETPLAGGKGAAWALINFALMNLAIFESVMLLIGYFVKTKNDEEEEKRKLKKKGIFRVISLPIAIISLIVFILTEDITLPTAFVDKYTIVMLIIAIVQTVMVALSNKKYEDEEEV